MGAVGPLVTPAAGYAPHRSHAATVQQPSTAPGELPRRRVAVFVDGFNLYHGMHDAFGRKYLWLDLRGLAHSLLKPDQRLASVTYFTAYVRGHPEGAARQAHYVAALRASGVRVVEGRFQEKPRRCLGCGATWMSYEEKESDVNLCVHLMEAAVKDEFDVALVVSGDSDMVPAIRAVRRMNPALRLVAVFPPRRFSEELRRAVHASLHVGADKIRQAQLPSAFTHRGKQYRRPDYWS